MVCVRKMLVSDYEGAYALWESVPGMNLRSLDNSEKGIAKIINRNPDLCFAAVEGDQVVGTALGGTDGRKGYLYHVAVAKDYQGRHISSQLISKVTQGFRQQGIEKVGLFVVVGNEDGQHFWEHQGFKPRPDIRYLDLDL